MKASPAPIRATANGGGEQGAEAAPVSAAHAVVRRSRDADLLVVGHRGRGAPASAVLGSVDLHCLLHVICPVTVVPPTRAEQRVPAMTAVAAEA